MTILAVHIRLLYKFENNKKKMVVLGVVDMRQLLLRIKIDYKMAIASQDS